LSFAILDRWGGTRFPMTAIDNDIYVQICQRVGGWIGAIPMHRAPAGTVSAHSVIF